MKLLENEENFFNYEEKLLKINNEKIDFSIKFTEALNESKRIMVGHKGELFVLYLSFIGWALLAIPTFGLICIWLLPYMKMTTVNFYNAIKPQVQNMEYSSEY